MPVRKRDQTNVAAAVGDASATTTTTTKAKAGAKESPLKRTKSVASLEGKPAARPAPWHFALSPEAIDTVELGEVDKWKTQNNRKVVDGRTGKVQRYDVPPGIVTEEFVSGLGRSPQDMPDGADNRYEITLTWGKIPPSVLKKNPRLAFEHREFVTAMRSNVEKIQRLMFDSNQYNLKGKKAADAMLRKMKTDQYVGWPSRMSILTKDKMTELVTGKLGIERKDAISMIDDSGLLVPGGAQAQHDAEIRIQLCEICKEAEFAAFEAEVSGYAFQQWKGDSRSPLFFPDEENNPEQMSMKFTNKVMFNYRPRGDGTAPPKPKPARQILSDPALQNYHDWVGAWGTHNKFDINFFAPPTANTPQRLSLIHI